MGQGYTRNDTGNNIADGNIINAADLDGEFDAVEAAFNETTGHTHDGTAAEGAPITVLGPVQDFIASATEIKPKTTNTLNIGTASLQFKDMYLDGTAYLDDIQAVGAVDITGDLDVDNININGNTISSTDTNGNITLAPNGTGVVALSSTDLTFGDNDKAIFGAGSDLQIYHSGGASHIDDVGTGDFKISTDGAGIYLNKGGSENMASFLTDGAVTLFYDNAAKLATTATGVDVTGDLEADGINIGTSSSVGSLTISEDTTDLASFAVPAQSNSLRIRHTSGGQMRFGMTTSHALSLMTNAVDRLTVDASGNVGIGGSETTVFNGVGGDMKFVVIGDDSTTTVANNSDAGIAIVNTNQTAGNLAGLHFARADTDNTPNYAGASIVARFPEAQVTGQYPKGELAFLTSTATNSAPSEKMRLTASGNVGIGLSSGIDGKLHVSGNTVVGDSSTTAFSSFTSGGLDVAVGSGTKAFQVWDDTNTSTPRFLVERGGNVGIANSSPTSKLTIGSSSISAGTGLFQQIQTAGNNMYVGIGSNNSAYIQANGEFRIATGGYADRVTVDSSGNVLVGKTAGSNTTKGSTLTQTGEIVSVITTAGGSSQNVFLNRQDAYGTCIRMRYANSDVGHIGLFTGNLLYLGAGNSGLKFGADIISPSRADNGNDRDNVIDLGKSASRFDDIYATNATIQTSDQNEKQQIAALTDAEMTAAKTISQLFKTFKWNDSVTEKGDAARTHAGVIAQDVQAAMTAAGLDAGDYAFFISSTWWETQTEVPAVEAVEAVYEDVVIPAVLDEDGNEVEAERTEQRLVTEAVEAVDAYTRTDTYDTAEEAPEGATERTRMGIRYPELLAFVGAATEQRLSNIETRLAALEAN